jgi:ATP-binding cassette subfamily B protein
MTKYLRLRRAVRIVWRSAPGWTMAQLALMLVQSVLPLASLYLMKKVIDSVTSGLTASDKGTAFGQATLFIVLMGAFAVLASTIQAVAGLVSQIQAQTVSDDMYDIVHAKSVAIDLAYYESAQYYDTFQRAQREASSRPIRVVNGLMQLGQNALSLIALVGLLLTFSWSIAAVLVFAVLPDVVVRLKYSRKTYRWQRERTPIERKAGYFDFLLTSAWHAKEVRLNDLGSLLIRRFRDLRRRLRREQIKLSISRTTAGWGAQIVSAIAVYGAYAVIASRAVAGAITLGDLVMFFQAFQRGQGYLQGFLNGLTGLYEDNLYLANLDEFLDLKVQVAEPTAPRPVPRPMRAGLVFDRVGFQYPDGTRPVLRDISLSIAPGQVVAIVGENGSGKTTLIKLLCRLYDPVTGTISLDGTDLKDFQTTELRREIGVIFQDYAQYHLSARENIWLGDVRLSPDDARIAAAARASGADAVIGRLPHGYDTMLGKWFEKGEELSIGEWQKIALARAFLRDAQLVVLDEPTSALDAKAEYDLFCKFRELIAGRSAVLISHRFSTVRLADCIYVLQDGCIIERGSHAELMLLNGRYARMFETQAQYYR